MAIGVILIVEGAINLLSALYTVLALRRFAKLHPETQSMLEDLTGEDLNGDGVVAPDVTRTDAEATAVELDHVDESARWTRRTGSKDDGLALSVTAYAVPPLPRERPWQRDEVCVDCQGLPL